MSGGKLTLRIDGALIEKAKRIAGERGTSVSGMVASFFEGLEGGQSADRRRHGPITSRLRGSLKPADGGPPFGEEDYGRHLEEKHG